ADSPAPRRSLLRPPRAGLLRSDRSCAGPASGPDSGPPLRPARPPPQPCRPAPGPAAAAPAWSRRAPPVPRRPRGPSPFSSRRGLRVSAPRPPPTRSPLCLWSSAALSPSKKRKNSKKKNQPGKYSQLVVETIRRLGERNGSSLAKIYAEAKKVAWFDQQNGRTYLKYSIKALVQNDTLLQVKGTGANGSFKLNRKKLEGGGGERRGAPAPASAPAPAAHKAKKAAPGAAAPRRADKKPAKGPQPEKRSHKKGAASKKDKGSKAKKAAVAGGKKVKKAAKPSVPKVPKGRK
uniref:H1.10 linker histone n=1 Tax=Ovis aries TaxID=9940 RepID=A0AC11BYC6_SHEEP